MEFNIDNLVRENIKQMKAYSSARDEYKGEANIMLDANENSFGSPLPDHYNRYPDPMQWQLKNKLSSIKGVPAENIFLGNGSDEAIDLLFRVFCIPGKDNAIIFPPTYGMYEVCAATNDVLLKKVPLLPNFQLDMETIENTIDVNTKLILICSPNNPTGNSMNRTDIELLLNNFDGLVVIDEAYINFSRQKTFINELTEYPNLVVLQTLSKAWGLAGLRIGMAFAGQAIINYLNKVKYPYNINAASQKLAIEALSNVSTINNWIKTISEQKEWLSQKISKLAFTEQVYPSDANFILVKMKEAKKIYDYLAANGIIVRDRSTVQLCDNCLRITIGTPEENKKIIDTLNNYVE